MGFFLAVMSGVEAVGWGHYGLRTADTRDTVGLRVGISKPVSDPTRPWAAAVHQAWYAESPWRR